jgi:aryl-alcohol dehydrogenase-like predicted oxidoreductase
MFGGLVAAEIGAARAQVALARLLAQGDDIVPIPGTRRSERVEEYVGADAIELSAGPSSTGWMTSSLPWVTATPI